ncbi:MAG: helix-turn-helix domain-containing protein [Epsilonproteobacteria bacterium]|nr:helix-turn-helix domain-containing protein [Campylobacterota bacterium]
MEFYKLGTEIKRLRKEQKLTQEQLAKEVGITRQTLSKLEKGNIDKVSLQVFIKILDALNHELEINEKKPFYYFDVNDL